MLPPLQVYITLPFHDGIRFSIGAQILIARRNGEGNYKEIRTHFLSGHIFPACHGRSDRSTVPADILRRNEELSAEDRGLVEKETREKVLAEAPEAEAVLETKAKEETPSEPVTEIKAILSGNVIPIEEVDDNVFSQKIMGDGVAIEPTDTTVVAPADAEVSIVMAETGHACGLTLANGMEILIHVGIDTVDMGGDGFKLLVAQGDHVKCGTPLIQFDPEKIRAAGHPCTTMLIVTAEGNAANVKMHSGMDAKAGETAVISWD